MAATTSPQMPEPVVFDVEEATTPQYTATVTDDVGALLPATSLSTLTLRLFVENADGTITYIRGSALAGQDVLNTNNVTVYNTAQSRADGSTYNLLWAIQTADLTLAQDLPFERHLALFEWTWPTSKNGKHLLVLNVQRLPGI